MNCLTLSLLSEVLASVLSSTCDVQDYFCCTVELAPPVGPACHLTVPMPPGVRSKAESHKQVVVAVVSWPMGSLCWPSCCSAVKPCCCMQPLGKKGLMTLARASASAGLPLVLASFSPEALAPQLITNIAAPQAVADVKMEQAGEANFGDFQGANAPGNLLAPFGGPIAPAAASLQQVSNGGGTAVDRRTSLGRSRYGWGCELRPLPARLCTHKSCMSPWLPAPPGAHCSR